MGTASLTMQDVFGPRAGGSVTTSARVTAGGPRVVSGGPVGEGMNGDLARAFTVSATSNPLYGFVVLALMLVGLAFLARRVGTVEEFRDIRLSVYNIIVISLAAIIGINFWKVLLTRFPVPHITPAVLAT